MNPDTLTDKAYLYLTQIDTLTNLPNRTYLMSELEEKFSLGDHPKTPTALLFIEFDDLARFNDTFGFDIDDQLILQLSEHIKLLLDVDDFLARVGNYQFAIASQRLQSEKSSGTLAKRIIHMLSEPFSVGENMFYVSASIGISFSSAEKNSAYRLLKTAENTMRHAQKDGKNYIAFTQYDVQPSLQKSVRLMGDLPAAIDNEEIYYVYQGQYSHKENRLNGAELLARWKHPQYGEVSPALFIPLAEQSGMIGPLTIKAIIEASRMFDKLKARGITDFSLSINISPVFLMESDFIETVQFLRQYYNLAGEKLNFEIMEDTLAHNMGNLAQLLEKIRDLGISIEIDDYGTGHTSLKYLENLPVDTLKVDKSFIRNIDKNRKRMALLKAIIDMSHALDIAVIAEGVETESEDRIIKKFKDITVQGYLYSKPEESAPFLDKLQTQ